MIIDLGNGYKISSIYLPRKKKKKKFGTKGNRPKWINDNVDYMNKVHYGK